LKDNSVPASAVIHCFLKFFFIKNADFRYVLFGEINELIFSVFGLKIF